MASCQNCGKECTRLYRRVYCRSCYDKQRNPATRKRNNARTKQRQDRRINFVGIDGEGVNVLDPASGKYSHRYVMLSCGNNTIHNHAGLEFDEILRFILQDSQRRIDPCYVGFFLGYDFTHWLKSLPEERADLLFNPNVIKDGKRINRRGRKKSGGNPNPFPVRYGDWEFDILGMRRFKFRKVVQIEEFKWKPVSNWITICDVGSFFQTSFLRVIHPENWPENDPICTIEEYATIEEGKRNREIRVKNGDESYLADMVKYNRLENEILARVMSKLNEAFIGLGVRLNRNQFIGPGQVCQVYAQKKNSPTN